jgi:uncharacterized protein YkwD
MVCMLSYARAAQGLPALRPYKPLHMSATHRARELKHCQRFNHEPCGRDFAHWIARLHVLKGHWWAGEVLAFGPAKRETVRTIVTAWLGSKEHRGVLLHKRYDLVGVGTTTGRFLGFRDRRIWVSHLGYRR